MIKRFIIAMVLIWVSLVVYIVVEEKNPQYQYNLVTSGTVLASGCVNGLYKGNITYDCSVDIEWQGGRFERMILKFGVLPDDVIGKYCGASLWKDYECRYGRVK